MRTHAVAVLLVAGCAKAPAPPVLDGTWPTQPGSYEATHASWTREGELRGDYQLIARIDATLMGPPYRAALIERRARAGHLGPEGRAALEEAQRTADESAWEVEIIMSTWDRRENDLDHGERSVWRVVLVDGAGHEVAATEIRRDKRPDEVIRAEFPAFDDFSRAYIARFPKDTVILGPGVSRVGLRLSSTRGSIDLSWQAGQVDRAGSPP